MVYFIVPHLRKHQECEIKSYTDDFETVTCKYFKNEDCKYKKPIKN